MDPFAASLDCMTSPTADVRFAIDDLYSTYLWALDTQDIDAYISVFWDDAVLKETQVDGTIEVWHSATAIREFTAGHFNGYGGHQHRESTRRYFPAGEDRWRVLAYWFASHRNVVENEVTFFSTGLSVDMVERRGDEWRFAQRGLSRWPADVNAAIKAIDEA